MSAAVGIAVAAGAVAAAVHGYVFVRESLLFSRTSTLEMFEVSLAAAPAVRLWAFHQGVYNLLLGATALAGTVALAAGAGTVGRTLVVASGLSMIVAAVSLVMADPRRVRLPGLAAQAGPALVAVAAAAAS